MDSVFHALADATRRKILDLVKAKPGMNVNELSSHFEMTRIGVLKHLKVLEDAELVLSERDGRNRRLHLNAVPIKMVHDRWTTEYSAHWAGRLTRLKYQLEADDGDEDP